ncbi:hypothetical protein VTN96DRAFT_7181 [Rasamsonia emersonii]
MFCCVLPQRCLREVIADEPDPRPSPRNWMDRRVLHEPNLQSPAAARNPHWIRTLTLSSSPATFASLVPGIEGDNSWVDRSNWLEISRTVDL